MKTVEVTRIECGRGTISLEEDRPDVALDLNFDSGRLCVKLTAVEAIQLAYALTKLQHSMYTNSKALEAVIDSRAGLIQELVDAQNEDMCRVAAQANVEHGKPKFRKGHDPDASLHLSGSSS